MATKNPYLKKANEVHEYTMAQVQELIKCAEDPEYFIHNYCKLQTATDGAAPFHLRPYQRRIIRCFTDNRLSIALAPRQIGKALSLDTEVPTPTGWTTMGDIKIGDLVLDAQGQPTRVTGATEIMYDHSCFEITLSTGERIIADADHQWTVINMSRGSGRHYNETLTTQTLYNRKLTVGSRGQHNYAIKTTKPLDLPTAQLPIDPYVVGAWLGDGTSRYGDITNHTKDDHIIQRCEKVGYECVRHPIAHSPSVNRVNLRGLQRQLSDCNLLNNKHIPITYLRASVSQRMQLLQGLMDTDGTVTKQGGCELTLTDSRLSADAFELISSLGFKATRTQRDMTTHTRYTITFKPYRDQMDVFSLPRKLERQQQSPHSSRVKSTLKREIISITPVASVPVRCITVDNAEHLFLISKSFIPTHNSWIAGAFLLWFAMFKEEKTVLILSNKNDNAMEMIHRVRFIYERLPHWLKPGLTADGWNKHSVSFDNHSRIISQATSAESGRGLSISLLFLDEFAFVRESIAEEFWTSVSPTLATGGKCIICSTPNGDMNRFAQLWRGANTKISDLSSEGVNGFAPVTVDWREPPNRDETFKEKEIAKIGITRWRQEYECLSVDTMVEIMDDNEQIHTLTMGELYDMLLLP